MARRSRKCSTQPRALGKQRRQSARDTLFSDEFADQPPAVIYHTLLERGENPCSQSTMHRILRDDKGNEDRRQQAHSSMALYSKAIRLTAQPGLDVGL